MKKLRFVCPSCDTTAEGVQVHLTPESEPRLVFSFTCQKCGKTTYARFSWRELLREAFGEPTNPH